MWRSRTAGPKPEPECLRRALDQVSKDECLSKLILFDERSLRRALSEYVQHYHAERNHQGRGNVLLFPRLVVGHRTRNVQCRQRLGGLLRYMRRRVSRGVFRRFLQFVYVADWAAHVSGDLHSWQR
jgi:hypothetical protein